MGLRGPLRRASPPNPPPPTSVEIASAPIQRERDAVFGQ